jgi:hypothetical protein
MLIPLFELCNLCTVINVIAAAGTSDKPRKEHFNARLFTYFSSVPQLQRLGYAAPLSASALDTTTKSSIVIINQWRTERGLGGSTPPKF